MKKILMALMCLCVCFQFSACGLGEEDTEWIETDAKKIGKDITCGEFVIDGAVFSFPMDLQDIIDKGWHVTNNVVNKDTFKLNPGEMSDEFQMFPDDDHEHSIKVSVINVSDKSATVDKCMVASLTVKEGNFDFVLPSGLNKRSKQEDVEKTYKNADNIDEEGKQKIYQYLYTSKDGVECTVELKVYNEENATYPLSEVNYWINLDEANGFGTTGVNAADVEKFMDLTMKASYHNNFAGYVSYGIDTATGAKELYQSEIEYFVYGLMEYADINSECVTDDVYEGYCSIAKDILRKAKWEISVKETGDSSCTVELTIYPTNYFDIISPKVDEAIDNYNVKYENVDIESISDEEYAQIEADYAGMVLAAIKGAEANVEYVDGIKRTYEFTGSGLTTEAWEEIDDITMGFAS